jgi:hypothetical protein
LCAYAAAGETPEPGETDDNTNQGNSGGGDSSGGNSGGGDSGDQDPTDENLIYAAFTIMQASLKNEMIDPSEKVVAQTGNEVTIHPYGCAFLGVADRKQGNIMEFYLEPGTYCAEISNFASGCQKNPNYPIRQTFTLHFGMYGFYFYIDCD